MGMESNKETHSRLINIVTPCSRPQYLKQLMDSINFPCKWFIVFDGDKGDQKFNLPFLNKDWIEVDYTKEKSWGYPQRNLGMSKAKNGFVFILDDDNAMHPDFYKTTMNIIQNEKIKGVFYSQYLSPSQIRKTDSNHVKLNYIDQGQFLLHVDIIGDKKYGVVKASDGRFIESLYKASDKNLFHFCNEPVVTYYNKLKWKTT